MKTLHENVNLNEIGLRRMPKRPDGTWLFEDIYVKGHFDAAYNHLISLEGSPKYVDILSLYGNYKLKTLEFIPFSYGSINLSFLYELTSLEGFTQDDIYGNFQLSGSHLETLEGCPKIVRGNFTALNCNITSLNFFPEKVQGSVDISNNPGNFTEEEIRAVCDVQGAVYSLAYRGQTRRT